MIKIVKSFIDGKLDTIQVDETEFPLYDEFVGTLERMRENNCHTMIVTLGEGLQVLYTISEKK